MKAGDGKGSCDFTGRQQSVRPTKVIKYGIFVIANCV